MMGMGRHDIATRPGEGDRPMAWGMGLECGGRETCTPSSDEEYSKSILLCYGGQKAVASETEGWRLPSSSRSIPGVEGRVVLLAWCHCSGMEAYAAGCVAHDRARVELGCVDKSSGTSNLNRWREKVESMPPSDISGSAPERQPTEARDLDEYHMVFA
ncbi:hypothetical protein CMUS01_01134 [Colletotrichum musicola]|uniref:Uncharacterized protein n=1 Tax=Colletotrichum musicola TaxID=2175873 RepID=A0A8H6NXB7_9PEZI|nr:hypothetical protein CMUS01_01134 [Colletotrichum musicola]